MRWYLIRTGRLTGLLALLGHEARNPAGFTVAGPPLRKRAVLPLTPPLELPPGVTRLDRADFPVRARVVAASWQDGALVLRGYAYIRNLDAAARHSYLKTAVLSCGRRRVLLPLRTVLMPAATAESGQEQHCYDWSGFEVRLDPARLRRGGRWEEGEWTLGLLLASAGVLRTASLAAPETGSGAAPCAHEVAGDGAGDGVRITPRYADGRLRLSVTRRTRRLAGRHAAAAGTLDLTVTAPGPPPAALRVTHQATGTVVSFPVETEPPGGPGPGQADATPPAAAPAAARLTFRIRLDALVAARPTRDGAPRAIAPAHTESWVPELVLPGGGTDPIACDPWLAPSPVRSRTAAS